MSSLISEIRSFIHQHNLILPGEHVMAAVSGGVDSMVMLYCLLRLRDELSFRLSVLHVNHGVRGADSDADEDLVRQVCGDHHLPFIAERLEGLTSRSNEEELRNARYQAYDRSLQEHKADRLATAHQLNDQLETFLMRLAKGASIRGLKGIPVKRTYLIRPMLSVSGKDIRRFAESEHIPFREDYTNFQTDRLRNRIRHNLIPVMEEILGRKFLRGYKKSAAELRKVSEYYRKYIEQVFQSLARTEGQYIYIGKKEFNELDGTLRRHMLEYCIYSFYGLYSNLEEKQFDEFEKFLASSKTGGRFRFSGDIQVEKDRDLLIFFPDNDPDTRSFELFPGESVCLGRNIIRLNTVSYEHVMWNNSRNEEYICGDRLKLPLVVRNWKHGDRFFPLGLKGEQKVSDFFINRKIPRSKKQEIPLVCNGQEIVWIAGLQLDDRYRISDRCKQVYRLTLENEVS